MSEIDVKRTSVVVAAALAAAIAIVAPMVWLKRQWTIADEKADPTYYETKDGYICPYRALWVKWELAQRNEWRKSQEDKHRKKADEAGNGCYSKQ